MRFRVLGLGLQRFGARAWAERFLGMDRCQCQLLAIIVLLEKPRVVLRRQTSLVADIEAVQYEGCGK